MEVLKLDSDAEKKIRRAAQVIKSGGLVVYPTDTLYGLGCNALSAGAVKKVFKAKQRRAGKPLPIAVDSVRMMKKYVVVDSRAEVVARKFLPGALTIVLKKKNLPDILTGGSGTVGVRIPNSETALKLIKLAGVPITATSANVSEETPPVSVEEVRGLKGVDLVLDAGKLEARVPSTVLDLTGKPKILRKGKIKKDEIESVIGKF